MSGTTPIFRSGAALTVALSLAIAAALCGCGDQDSVDARSALLEAESAALAGYLAGEASGSIVPHGDALIVVRGGLLRELLGSILPLETTVGAYRLRLDSAEVDLRPGLAVVRLGARAAPAAASSVFADVVLLGAFEIAPLSDDRGELVGRVRIFGIDTRDVGMGALSPPAERIVDALARLRQRAFSDVVGRVEIPVHLDEVLGVPAVREKEATIPAAELPVGFELAGVRVLEEGIVVSLRVEQRWRNVARWSVGGLEPERGGSAPEPGDRQRPTDAPSREREARLAARVSLLRDSLRRRAAGDSLLLAAGGQPGQILIGLRTGWVRELAAWMAGTYLDRVQLHLEPDVRVRHEQQVKAKLGPLSVTAGRWSVDLGIRAVRASLRVGAVHLAPIDAERIGAVVTVRSEGGSGEAEVDFRWDAAAVPSLICRDFAVQERFAGTVPPEVYRLRGFVSLEAVAAGVRAVPDFSNSPIRVRPEPTDEAWERIRSILRKAEASCGPLDPEDVIEKLRGAFAEGFRFELPDAIFRPLLLPTRVRDRIRVADRDVEFTVTPTGLRIDPATIWYGVDLSAGGSGSSHEDSSAGAPAASLP